MALQRPPIGNYHVPSGQNIYRFNKVGLVTGGIGIVYESAPASTPPPPSGGNNGIINTSGDLTKNVVRVFI